MPASPISVRLLRDEKDRLTNINNRFTTMRRLYLTLLLTALTGIANAQQQFTGKGVNVVIIDTGFDLLHPAFTDEQGNTRIKELFVFMNKDGEQVTVDDDVKGRYTLNGSVFNTPEAYAEQKTDLSPMLRQMAAISHGSHVTGIAAARRSPFGMEGQAPDCDIYMVSMDGGVPMDGSVTSLNEADVLDEVTTYIINRVAANGQPTVVNYSKGQYQGPHDGTGKIAQLMRRLAERGIIFCAATGNAGRSLHHLHKAFKGDDDVVRTFIPLHGEDSTDSLQVYTRHGQNISLQFEIYDRQAAKVVWTSEAATKDDREKTFNSGSDAALAAVFSGQLAIKHRDWEGGRANVSLSYMGTANTEDMLLAVVAKGGDGTEADLWSEYNFRSNDIEGYTEGTADINTTEVAASRHVISVGNYDATNDTGEMGAIDMTSSFGTMLDGTVAPIICAHGQHVLSCANGQVDGIFDGQYNWDGHPYMVLSGTSMASPYVAGVIATWLEANPNLTVGDVQTILRETALQDEHTAEAGPQAGYGKLDKQKALQRVLSMTGIHSVGTSAPASDNAWYTLEGIRLAGKPTAKGLYVNRGRIHIK